MVTTPVRLVPRWFSSLVIVVLALFALGMLALALVDDGVMRWSAWGLSAAAGLVLCSAVSALVVPRGGRPIHGADGTVTFLSPALTVWPLVGAWAAVLWVAATWAYVAVTDFGELESPGFALVTIAGRRGLTARPRPPAHRPSPSVAGRDRPRFHLLPGLPHRPDVAAVEDPRCQVHPPRSLRRRDARSEDERQLAGVVIDLKGAGTDPVIPMAAFRAAPQTMIEEIERAKAAARR